MSLLQMSLAGAVMILCVATLRVLAIHRLPKGTFLVLWGVALVRLLIPYSLPSAFSVYSLLARLTPAAEPAVGTPVVEITTVAPGGYVPPATPAVPVAPEAVRLVDPWLVVWLVGALICAVYFATAYGRCHREFRASLPVNREEARAWLREYPLRRPLEIRQSDQITAPLTYGVLRPVILMPKTTDWEDLDTLHYALAHEYIHIRRFDALTKLVLTAALCVHWFNPAVWMMVVLANRDLELSCDEAVVCRFGMDAKSAYAAALLRMEEARSGFTPLYNHFSKNAMKERMVAIMKLKRTSSLAILIAAVLVIGMTTAFATSKETTEAKNQIATHITQAAEQDVTVASYTDPADGKTYYSWDGGKTWTPDFNGPALPEIEWWTAEEYETWLENEKVELQRLIGERAWTSGDGWFTWDQEKVDEAITMYEGILEDIKNGMLYSKTVYGEEDGVVISMNPGDIEVGVREAPATGADFAQYAPYGLTWDNSQQALFWNGQRVRYFVDSAEVDGGMAIRIEYADAERKGEVDVRTVREQVQNADGSVDPMGPLTGLEAYSQAEFDARTFPDPKLEAVTFAVAQETEEMGFQSGRATLVAEGDTAEVTAQPGMTLAQRFKRYAPFGITYEEAEGASGGGNVYYNGQLVSRFTDITPDGGAFSWVFPRRGGISVRTVYGSDGRLAGVEAVAE